MRPTVGVAGDIPQACDVTGEWRFKVDLAAMSWGTALCEESQDVTVILAKEPSR